MNAPRAEGAKPLRQSKAYQRAAAFLAETDEPRETPKPKT